MIQITGVYETENMWEKIADVLLDTLLDCVKLLPFLLAAYLLIEWLEHRAGDRFGAFLKRSGRLGPLIGGLLGLVPQCGFSVVCANFYAGGLVSMGTVIAVMLATSDEALPLLLTEGIGSGMQIAEILLLLATKLVIGVAAGFAVDAVSGVYRRRKALKTAPDAAKSEQAHVHAHTERECEGKEHEEHSEHGEHGHNHNTLCEHCGCEEQHGFVRGILLPALKHVGSIMLFIFAVTLALNAVVEFIGEDSLKSLLGGSALLQPVIAAIFGFIPNCAASVVITELYISGGLGFGAAVAGLCTGAGTGLLMLFRANRSIRQNLTIMGIMFAVASLSGIILQLITA